MDEDNIFTDEELHGAAEQLARILSETAPHRPDTAYPREIKVHGRVISPMPRNLQLNGQIIVNSGDGYAVKTGYEPAPYALYANKFGRQREGEHGAHYIERSIEKFRGFAESEGWEEE